VPARPDASAPPPGERTILHVDLDAFYAAVEQRERPELRGRPVIVGGSVRRGVVAACSYEARAFGVHSAMPMAIAVRRCPRAVVVAPRMDLYAAVSRQFFAILADYAPEPEIEALSLDEAFLELTGSERLLGTPLGVAQAIKARVRAELSLVVSAGIAPIKFAAKIASDIDKPDGLRVVRPDQLVPFLHALPVGRLWGVGEVTRDKLAALGIGTIGDLARYPATTLAARLGPGPADHLRALAHGRDPRLVEAEGLPRSVGHQETFDDDLTEPGDVEVVLCHQADRVAARLRALELRARVVVLIIKYDDFRQITRRVTLPDPSCDARVVLAAARELLRGVRLGDAPTERVRLAGISTTELEGRHAPRQLGFAEAERARGERLGDTLDRVAARFGQGLVQRAVHLGPTARAEAAPDAASADDPSAGAEPADRTGRGTGGRRRIE
jgi:DNA polymerase-4